MATQPSSLPCTLVFLESFRSSCLAFFFSSTISFFPSFPARFFFPPLFFSSFSSFSFSYTTRSLLRSGSVGKDGGDGLLLRAVPGNMADWALVPVAAEHFGYLETPLVEEVLSALQLQPPREGQVPVRKSTPKQQNNQAQQQQ
jgi:hypothetical protein